MRGLVRNRTQAEEEESVFVTMTDMTISFLLIVMILLAFFATQLSSKDTVPRDQYDVILRNLREARSEIHQIEVKIKIVTEERDEAVEERDRLRLENDRIPNLEATIVRLDAELKARRDELDKVKRERDELLARLSRLQQINPLEAYLSQAIEQRREILIELKKRLLVEFPDLRVVISKEQDALRFQGEGLFPSGVWELGTQQRLVVQTMGRLLNEILNCYTLGERATRSPKCKSGDALIETVQIEGHTDNEPGRIDNVVLSTQRANATFFAIRSAYPSILAHENLRGQPVLSVSGYGEMRPIETNNTPGGRADNRRIDLRIIMYAPSTVEEVEEIGHRLDALRTAGGAE